MKLCISSKYPRNVSYNLVNPPIFLETTMQRVSQLLGHMLPASNSLPLVYSPEVADALKNGRAVVALESTIISHGMKYPDNVKTAVEVEDIVRSYGAAPATIAILDGVVHIGLDKESLEKLAFLGPKVKKCSRRDLAQVIAEKGNGATTVASTSLLAHMAGIQVFVTGTLFSPLCLSNSF